MPGKTTILNAIGIVLQYGLTLLLYYFLFRVLRAIYRDLKSRDRALQPDTHAVPEPTPVENDGARLVTVDAGGISTILPVYRLSEMISIGRSESNDIAIPDSFVSHEHACIARYRSGFRLTDLNSTNGTLHNNLRVTEEIQLVDGDLIRIGAVTFRFER